MQNVGVPNYVISESGINFAKLKELENANRIQKRDKSGNPDVYIQAKTNNKKLMIKDFSSFVFATIC